MGGERSYGDVLVIDLDQLSIEHLCVFGLPPVEHVALASELGCRHISIVPGSNGSGPDGHRPWSLLHDAALRRDTIAALASYDVSISLGDGLVIRPDRDATEMVPALNMLAELSVPRIATVSFDPDLSRSFDQFAVLAQLARERGMGTVLELVPVLPVNSLPIALDAVRHVALPEFTLLMDTMHFARTGITGDDLRSLPAELIGYAQLCDAPSAPPSDYLTASITERLPPGEGDLPLSALVVALPADLVIGLEVPMRSAAKAGVTVRERVSRCIEGALALS